MTMTAITTEATTATQSGTRIITVTADHVRRCFDLWRTGDVINHPLCRICPLALAFKDALGLPIEVGRNDLFLHNETITHDGLSEDLKRFESAVNNILIGLGWPDGEKAKDPAHQADALAKLLALVPFRFEFDVTGLPLPEEAAAGIVDTDSESENQLRQEIAHGEAVMQEIEAMPDDALFVGELVTTETATDTYTLLPQTLTGLRLKHGDLVAERSERRDFFAAAAFAYGESTSKENKEELQRAMRSLRRIDKNIAAVAADIRKLARREAEKLRVPALSHQIGDLSEADLADFASRLVRNYPDAAAIIATAALTTADCEEELTHA